jgi:hypothetical protein
MYEFSYLIPVLKIICVNVVKSLIKMTVCSLVQMNQTG